MSGLVEFSATEQRQASLFDRTNSGGGHRAGCDFGPSGVPCRGVPDVVLKGLSQEAAERDAVIGLDHDQRRSFDVAQPRHGVDALGDFLAATHLQVAADHDVNGHLHAWKYPMKSVESQAEIASPERGSVVENRGCEATACKTAAGRHVGPATQVAERDAPPLQYTARLAATLAFLALAACATHPAGPPQAPTLVQVPVPVACVKSDFPGPPTYPDTKAALKAAPDWAARDQLMRAGWDMRDSRLAVLERQIAVCR